MAEERAVMEAATAQIEGGPPAEQAGSSQAAVAAESIQEPKAEKIAEFSNGKDPPWANGAQFQGWPKLFRIVESNEVIVFDLFRHWCRYTCQSSFRVITELPNRTRVRK
jgi:hypothetical protein